MKKSLLALLSVLFLSCASKTDYAASPEKYPTDAEKGIAIGTLTFEGDIPVNEIYRFFYEPTGNDKAFKNKNAGKIIINTPHKSGEGWNGDFGNRKTYLVVIEREPGTYAFNKYSYLNRLGPTGEVSYSKDFAIPFEIKKGAVTYFGELNYIDKAVKGTPRIFVADYLERDIKEFEKKYPELKGKKVENNTPRSGNTGEGTVDFRF